MTSDLFRTLVDQQAEFVSLAQPDGTLVYANPAYAQQMGSDAASIVGRSLFEFIEPADRAEVRALLDRALNSGEVCTGENRTVRADGSECWVWWSNRRLMDGTQPLLHSVGREITHQRVQERALRDSRALLARTGRVAGIGGWQFDVASGHIEWSEQTRAIHEVGPDYVPQLDTAVAFYAPEARLQLEAAMNTALERDKPWDLELPLTTATGRAIWVRTQGEVERDAQGRPVRYIGAFQDITDRKLLEQRAAESERLLRQITDALPIRISYVDRQRRIRFANRAYCERHGLARNEVLGRTRAELLGQPDEPDVLAHGLAALQGRAQRYERDELIAGHARRFDCQLVPDITAKGLVAGYFFVAVDITAEAASRREIQRQSDILRSVTEAIPATVVVVGGDSRYHFVNSAFERYAGKTREHIVGRTAMDVLGEVEVARRRPWMKRALEGETVRFTLDYPTKDGTTWLELTCVPLRMSGGAVDGFVGISQDITAQQNEQQRLTQLTLRDPLTGLLNRAGFEQQIEHHVHRGGGAGLGLLYIDLDRFKPVNDEHGHPVGDGLLQAFAQRLKTLVRPSDAVARLGGDEFAILLASLREAANAETVAAKVVAAAAEPFTVNALPLHIGASVGVAFAVNPELGWRDLIARADAALYRAKAAGRGTHVGETR